MVPANFEHNLGIVERLTAIAETRGATLAQLALAWILARGEHVVPIPGSRNPRRVEENVGAARLELTGADMQALADVLGDGPRGERHTMLATWD